MVIDNMTDIDFEYQKPCLALSHFVESFWVLTNNSNQMRPCITLPDGKIDLVFPMSPGEPYSAALVGLDSEPSQNGIPPKTSFFAVSFKLPAMEYVIKTTISPILNKAAIYPLTFGK